MRAVNVLAILAILAVLPACMKTVPVERPCGVLRDDLKTVRGATDADQDRIDVHYIRGRAAGCWR